jgi:hypothetical protein
VAIADGGKPGLADNDERLGITVTHATHLIDEAMKVLFFYRFFYRLKNFERTRRSSARGGADQNHRHLVIPYLSPAGFGLSFYFLEFQFFSFSSFSF